MDWSDLLYFNPATGPAAWANYGIGQLGGTTPLDAITKKPQLLGPSPYKGEWDKLISQLQAQASGTGPSLAAEQYRAASQTALGQQAALSYGHAPGAARNASNNMANISLGQAQGMSQARTQEQMGAMNNLNAAIQAANQADYQRQYANQQAVLQTPTQFQQIMGMLGQGASTAAAMTGGGAGAAGMAPMMGQAPPQGVPPGFMPTGPGSAFPYSPPPPNYNPQIQGAGYGMFGLPQGY